MKKIILTLLILGGGGFFVVYASDYPSSISSTDFLIEQSTGTKEKMLNMTQFYPLKINGGMI